MVYHLRPYWAVSSTVQKTHRRGLRQAKFGGSNRATVPETSQPPLPLQRRIQPTKHAHKNKLRYNKMVNKPFGTAGRRGQRCPHNSQLSSHWPSRTVRALCTEQCTCTMLLRIRPAPRYVHRIRNPRAKKAVFTVPRRHTQLAERRRHMAPQ